MKVKMRVTNLETGKVSDVVLDAESEAAALAMYKGSNLHAAIAPPEVAKEPSKLFGHEVPEWVAGKDGADGLIRGLLIVAGICCVPVVLFAAIIEAQRNPPPPGAVEGFLALASLGGVGLTVFLIIYYLRKIANKSG